MAEPQEIVQLNVRVPVGMVRVLDQLAEEEHLSRAHYLARLVKEAQAAHEARHDGEIYRVSGQTKLGRSVTEHSLDLLVEVRESAR